MELVLLKILQVKLKGVEFCMNMLVCEKSEGLLRLWTNRNQRRKKEEDPYEWEPSLLSRAFSASFSSAFLKLKKGKGMWFSFFGNFMVVFGVLG
jgi:hypothetical protein